MKFQKALLNFSHIRTIDEMHLLLKEHFEFPDYYDTDGNVANSNPPRITIECLSELRDPKEKMTNILLECDEILILEIRGLTYKKDLFLAHLLGIAQRVNDINIQRGEEPSLLICPVNR